MLFLSGNLTHLGREIHSVKSSYVREKKNFVIYNLKQFQYCECRNFFLIPISTPVSPLFFFSVSHLNFKT